MGCVASDKCAYFWSIYDGHKMIFKKKFGERQINIWYFEQSQFWAIGSYNHEVSFWSMKLRMKKEVISFLELLEVAMHLDRITGLVEVGIH